MRSKAAGQMINCWQTAADPQQTFDISPLGEMLSSILAHGLIVRRQNMSSLSLTAAFNRYAAKLANPQWAVSAISSNGELVVSCWKHYLKPIGGTLRYVDRLSRWDGNAAGNNLLRDHLTRAMSEDLPVRLVIARTEETDIVDAGEDASKVAKSFGVREDVVGRVVAFDGDVFEFEFKRKDM